MKSIRLKTTVVITGIFLLSSCNQEKKIPQKAGSSDTIIQLNATHVVADIGVPPQGWNYTIINNKRIADIWSMTSGNSAINIELHPSDTVPQVILKVINGNGLEYSRSIETTLRVTFDGKTYDNYLASRLSYDSLLYISPARKFISSIETAKRMSISAQIFQERRDTFWFDVKGLKM